MTMTNIPTRALLLIVAALALPLSAASPEYLIGDTVATAAANSRGFTTVASDGTDFLVVWADFRATTVRSITATRVTRTGRVLDPLGIRIASTTGSVLSQSTVWDGDAYLVVWTAGSYTVENGLRYDIHAARLDRNGKVVMQPRVVVEHAMLTAGGAPLATNGNVSVVTYYDNQPPFGPRVVALDRDGNRLHDEPVPGGNSGSSYVIAASASSFVVTWSTRLEMNEPLKIHAVALTSEGRVAAGPAILGEGGSPTIASDGSRFAIVSFDNEAIQARVIDADLAQIGHVTTIMPIAPASPFVTLLWHAGRYQVHIGRYHGWSQFAVRTTELDADGHVIATHGRDQPAAAAATNGSDVLAVFASEISTSTYPQPFGALYRGTANVADAIELLSWSGNAHGNPVVARGPNGHLVAWNEESGVYFTRVAANGSSLDGRGVLLAPKASVVRVAFDGTNYVAAWKEAEAIGTRRIAPATGATVSELLVPLEPWYDIGGLALATSPDATYLVYTNRRVYVARIPHAANTLDPRPLAVSPEDMNVDGPAAAWNGSALLVAWNEIHPTRFDPPYPLAVKTLAARVTPLLSLLDPEPLLLGEKDDRNFVEFGAPAVASNGADWLVAAHYGAVSEAKDVYARRVRSDGTLEGAAMQRILAGANAAAMWDGTRYAVASKDGESVRLAEVTASGALAVTRQTIVATSPALSTLSIAPAANGEAAVAYTKLSFLPQHTGVERTFLRFMDYGMPRGRVVRR